MDFASNVEMIVAGIIVVVLGVALEVFIYVQTYGVRTTKREKQERNKRVGLAAIFIVALLIGILIILLLNQFIHGS